jgi:putative SOS response-associated peptidase YedK
MRVSASGWPFRPQRIILCGMCCRFMRQSSLQTLAGWFDVELAGIPFFASSYNIAPQSVQPVVRLNPGAGSREFALQRWGWCPSGRRTPN